VCTTIFLEKFKDQILRKSTKISSGDLERFLNILCLIALERVFDFL
jgi:hypothetical protein